MLLLVFCWFGGVWVSVEEKIAICITDIVTFQTLLDLNLMIVKKLFSVLLCKACKFFFLKKENKIKRKPN